jgi:hypothetical protein
MPTSGAYRYDYEQEITLTREYRKARETDDFLERGDARVTESPIFEDGIRLSAQGFESEAEPRFSLASAIYFFDVPRRAESVAITVSYISNQASDEVAGRLWVRDVTKSDEGQTRYGVTFALSPERRREKVHLAASRYIDRNGILEANIVVQNREELDVEYIEIEAYDHTPKIRVVERYNYLPPRPWHQYYYHYYYTGPYYVTVRPYHYVLYEDWWLDDWYFDIRIRFHNYLGYHPHPYRFYRCYWRRPIYVPRRYWYDDPDPIVVRQLPKPRTKVQYVESRLKKRRFYSRSRLNSPSSQSRVSSVVRQRKATDIRPRENRYERRPSQQSRDARTRISESRVKRRPSSIIQQDRDIRRTFQRNSTVPPNSSAQKQRRVIRQSRSEQTRIQRSPSSTIRRQKRRPSSSRSTRTSSSDDEERRKRRR